MRGFWVLWGFDLLVAAVVFYFFVVGVADGSVSSFNLGLWVVILAVVAGVVFGSLGLRSAGRRRTAFGLLWVLAVPGLLFVVFFAAVLVTHPRWN
jgi:hypothetical protein